MMDGARPCRLGMKKPKLKSEPADKIQYNWFGCNAVRRGMYTKGRQQWQWHDRFKFP